MSMLHLKKNIYSLFLLFAFRLNEYFYISLYYVTGKREKNVFIIIIILLVFIKWRKFI